MAVLWSWVLLCYGVGLKCRRIVPIGTDGDDPSQLWPMVSMRVRLSVRERLRKHSLRCYGVGWNVGGSSRSGRIVTTRHCGDGWCRSVSVCLCTKELENIHCGVVEWGENVGGSSRSGRIVTTRHSGDGWCRFVSVRGSKSSLRKNQRPFKPALGWVADFSSVAKLFVWNLCHLYVHSLENYIKWFLRKMFCIRICSKKEVTATLKWK